MVWGYFLINKLSPLQTFAHESTPEHLRSFHGGQPEAVGVGIEVTCPSAVALDERGAAELLQAGAGGGERLTGALCARTGVLWGEKEELEL